MVDYDRFQIVVHFGRRRNVPCKTKTENREIGDSGDHILIVLLTVRSVEPERFVGRHHRPVPGGDDPAERHEERVHQNGPVNDTKPDGHFHGVERVIKIVVDGGRHRIVYVDDVFAATIGRGRCAAVSVVVVVVVVNNERTVEP